MNLRDKAYFKDRVSREMAEDLPAVQGSVAELLAHTCRILAAGGIQEPSPALLRESGEFLMQSSIVRGTFAYWSRRCA